MPTPIDGKFGPSVMLSMLNFLLPIAQNPPLVNQIIRLFERRKKAVQ